MTHHLSFDIRQRKKLTVITPMIDGVTLSKLVTRFEKQSGYNDPAGGYGGLLPSLFNYGPLDTYFLGQAPNFMNGENSWAYFLGCECGEVGCWPIIGNIQVSGETVIWNNFSQPQRDERDYTNFGSFIFHKRQYAQAIETLTK